MVTVVPRPAAKAIEIEDVEARVSDLERRRSAEEVMKAALLKQPAPPRAITSLATCASGCFTASHSQAENYHEIYARGMEPHLIEVSVKPVHKP